MIEITNLIEGEIVKVILPQNTEGYDYIIPGGNYKIGDVVRVPFRNSERIGVIFGKRESELDYPISKVKTILGKVLDYNFSSTMRSFVQKVAAYNMASTGNVLKMSIPSESLFETPARERKEGAHEFKYSEPELNEEQTAAAAVLTGTLGGGFATTLLDGITGSGKTEVYFKVVAEALARGDEQVLILLPEISLTSQFLEKFKKRFGTEPWLWHSGLTPQRRRKTWRAAANGEARVIVGTRSALFLPFKKLALIVLDEEHDSSYKQEEQVIYHGRDMAVLRASVEEIPIILASATPAVETFANVEAGKYGAVRLVQRFNDATLPDITLIDMKLNKPATRKWISESLAARVFQVIDDGQQVMLYINRRGYAPVVLCGGCGEKLGCPNCSVNLTAHGFDDKRMLCHYCGHTSRLPEACPKCGKSDWVLCGPGIERIEEEVRQRWAGAKILTISSDILTSQTKLAEIIGQIERKEADIIIGTQIVVKGHHFPSLTLVGVIDGDASFAGGDLRANENTFQILTQVSGRSGRGELRGEVLIQTYNPENPVMQAIAHNDRDAFIKQEIEDRRVANMPPFSRLASVLVTSHRKDELESFCYNLARFMPYGVSGVSAYGPIDAGIARLQKQFRKRFLFVFNAPLRPQPILTKWLDMAGAPPSSVRVKVDIDPYSFG